VLAERYAAGTIRRAVKRARQFFRSAIRAKILTENPFEELKLPSDKNPARQFIVTPDTSQKVLDACPDPEWRLIFALSRFGGLRWPSEHLALKWTDVDWGRDRFLVRSPKTEHHEDGGQRWVPIFPELRGHLVAAFEAAPDGVVHLISRYRGSNANLRTQLTRIIERAGLIPWPKLFQNLRATRQTELAATWPIHIVCEWMGNSELIAAKHYLQVTEADFQKAAQKAAQQPVLDAAKRSNEPQEEMTSTARNSAFSASCGSVPVAATRCAEKGYPQGDSNPCLSLERAMS
jgi:integrase